MKYQHPNGRVERVRKASPINTRRGAEEYERQVRPLTAGMTEHRLERALGRASITRDRGCLTWHDLRHTYGSHLAMRGVALKVIQELMGHATIEMTMRYAHLSPEARESAVQELDRAIPMTARRAGLETPAGHTGGT